MLQQPNRKPTLAKQQLRENADVRLPRLSQKLKLANQQLHENADVRLLHLSQKLKLAKQKRVGTNDKISRLLKQKPYNQKQKQMPKKRATAPNSVWRKKPHAKNRKKRPKRPTVPFESHKKQPRKQPKKLEHCAKKHACVAEVVVQAEAEKQRQVVQAEAEKEQLRLVAEGEAAAILAQKQAEAQGTQAILNAKAEGYRQLVDACGGNDQAAAAFLIIERLTEVAGIQAEAIRNLPIEKIMVWDSGNGESGMSNLGQNLMGAIPPMHDLARLAGLELPEFLGKMNGEHAAPENEKTDAVDTTSPEASVESDAKAE